MRDILTLRSVERAIESVARKFFIDGLEFEDLVQIGRISVWSLLAKHDITEKNIDQYMGLIVTSVRYGLSNELKKSKAQKRLELTKAFSLDAALDEEDDERTLGNLIPSGDRNVLEALEADEADREKLRLLARRSLQERTPKGKRAVVLFLVSLLGLRFEDIPKALTYAIFVQFGLARWLWVFFNNSPFRAINHAYPGKFHPYDMARAPMRQWKGERGKARAIRALQDILEDTGYGPECYPRLLTHNFFEEFKIAVPLGKIFGWDRFRYLDAAFPGAYRPWELSRTPQGFFDSPENVKLAVRWLVEEKLGYDMECLSVHDIWRLEIASKRITKDTFLQHGLRELMATYGSPERVLRLAYPGKFLPWSFSRKDKWYGRSGKALAALATRWVIERYAKTSPLSPAITCSFFMKHGLWGMLTARSLGFNSSPRKALRNAYPRLFP